MLELEIGDTEEGGGYELKRQHEKFFSVGIAQYRNFFYTESNIHIIKTYIFLCKFFLWTAIVGHIKGNISGLAGVAQLVGVSSCN